MMPGARLFGPLNNTGNQHELAWIVGIFSR
jgi:hypothetical protein